MSQFIPSKEGTLTLEQAACKHRMINDTHPRRCAQCGVWEDRNKEYAPWPVDGVFVVADVK